MAKSVIKWDKKRIKWDKSARIEASNNRECERRAVVQNLIGEYTHKMDAKGRVSLPAVFRKDIAPDAQLVIAPNPTDEYLFIYLKQDYIKWIDTVFDGIGGYCENDPDHVNLRSMLMGSACEAEIDAAGRIMVTAPQREIAALDKEVVLVGNGERIEVWDLKRREEARAQARSMKSLLLRKASK